MTPDNTPRLPLRLTTRDIFGFSDIDAEAVPEVRALLSLYGLLQIVADGLPDLQNHNRTEATIAALFRDATVTLASCVAMAARGVYEPIIRQHRALLESRLYIQLIRSGSSEDLANLLAADRLLNRKRHFQKQIDLGFTPPDDPWIRKHLTDIKKSFKDPHLKAAKDELARLKARGLNWHGAKNLSELADKLGETRSYELVYVPTSGLFVHPGDSDVHLMEVGDAVRIRPLKAESPESLAGVLRSVIAEGFQILQLASEPWALSPYLRLAIDEAVPMLVFSLDPDLIEASDRQTLEAGAGLPVRRWHEAFSVKFVPNTQTRKSGQARTAVLVGLAAATAVILLWLLR